MNGQFDYQAAIKAGYGDSQIQDYLKSNPTLQVINGPTASPTPPPTQADTGNPSAFGNFINTYNQTQQQSQNQGNPFLDFVLPTAGGLLGGVAGGALMPFGGEIAGGAVGMAGGQYLADLLQGKKPGFDVATAGIGGLAGGALGGIGGKVLGKILGGVGDDLASGALNLTKTQLAKYAANFGETVPETLTKAGLAGANSETLGQGINTLEKTYSAIAKSDTKVDPNTLLTNANKVIQGLRTQAPASAQADASAIEKEFMDNVIPKVGDNPTMKDIQALKGQYDAQTTASQFNANPAQWNVNRSVGQILRQTLNDSADAAGLATENGTPLSDLGKTIMKLKDLEETAQNRVGVGGVSNPFSISNLLLGGTGGAMAAAAGANPLLGLLLPGARILGGKVLENPAVAGTLSKGATMSGEAITKALPFLTMGGVLAGGNAANGEQSPSVPVGQGGSQPNNNQENNNTQFNPSSNNIAQTTSNNQPDQNGNYNLPSLNTPLQVPQIYPIANRIADMQKYGSNPVMLEKIRAAGDASDKQALQFIQSQQLVPQEQQFMQTAGQTNEMMNTLRGLIQSKSGQNLFEAVLNDNPAIQYIKSQQDPQYAQMLAIMSSLKGAAVRAVEGGRPSNFDIKIFNNAPAPGDTAQTALAKLGQAQKFLVDQYTRLLPAYTYSLMAPYFQTTVGGANGGGNTTPTPSLTGNSTLDQILSPGMTGGGQ